MKLQTLLTLKTLAALALFCMTAVANNAASIGSPGPVSAHSRAVSLAPHITELIFAAGAGDRIVATVTASDFPAEAQAIPRIGDGIHINVEKIIASRPDLIVAWQQGGAAETLRPWLGAMNATLMFARPEKLADIPELVRELGRQFGTEAIAGPAADEMTERLNQLTQHYAHRRTVTAFLEIGTAPLYTIGNDPLLNDALRICAGANPYAQSPIAAPQVNPESLLVKQPDVIITQALDPAKLEQRRQAWAQLRVSAAMQGHVYGIDPDQLYRPGPRLIDATEALCHYLDRARKNDRRP